MNNPNVSWIGVIYHALPQFLRKQKLVRYLKSAFVSLIWIYDNFLFYRSESIFRLRYSGQVVYLEHMLNARFNNGEPAYIAGVPNGIYIGAGAITFDPFYIYQASENMDEDNWLWDESEAPATEDKIWLYSTEEIENQSYDFTVFVPIAVGDITTNLELYHAIRAWVYYYRQAGKQFIIVNY